MSQNLFEAMPQEMDHVFERFESGWPRWPSVFGRDGAGLMVPTIDVREDGKSITIEADPPGVDDNDVSVTLANGVLTIKGENWAAVKRRYRKEGEHWVA